MSEARTRWSAGFRDALWAGLDRAWDLVIVGGGITGAGLCREAARLGLSVLLVEGHDFAWGTSSRSSKLVHGGLRYLTTFQPHLTAESVHERDRLLRDGGGLVEPLDFVLADYEFERLSGWQVRAGLWVYDRLSGRPSARHLDRAAMLAMVPGLAEGGLRGGHMYADAITDDARLVARVLHEATWAGATALNYVAAEGLVRRADGRVVGVALHDRVGERRAEVRARAVVNATGVWADGLRGRLGREPRMRPLRGSHLVFDRALLPVDQAVSLLHPRDRRPLYVYPWEGSTLVGTTDLDHHEDLEREARITEEELAYILEVVTILFPERGIERERVVSTYAGVRPVVRSRTREASAASRDHVVWHEDGLWTVTGGKLTTFRRIALDALRRLRRDLPEIPRRPSDHPALDPPTAALASAVAAGLGEAATPELAVALLGRHGRDAAALCAHAAGPGELATIEGTRTTWAELRWAAHAEGIVHLDDLLLRRTRVGHLLAGGGAAALPRIRALCQGELGWDDARWLAEEARYLGLWRSSYGVPGRDRE